MKLTDIKRVCKGHTDECLGCPCYKVCNDFIECLADDELQDIETKCEKWLAEHTESPKKTRQSEFLKLFPGARIDENGVCFIFPCHIDKNLQSLRYERQECSFNCEECKQRYWFAEVEDDEA